MRYCIRPKGCLLSNPLDLTGSDASQRIREFTTARERVQWRTTLPIRLDYEAGVGCGEHQRLSWGLNRFESSFEVDGPAMRKHSIKLKSDRASSSTNSLPKRRDRLFTSPMMAGTSSKWNSRTRL